MNEFICYCPNLYCKCKSGCSCLKEKTDNIVLDTQWCLCCELQKLNYQQKRQANNDVKKLELEENMDGLYSKITLNSGKTIKSNTVEIERGSSSGLGLYVDNISLDNNNYINLIYNSGGKSKTNIKITNIKNFDINNNELIINLDNNQQFTVNLLEFLNNNISYNSGQLSLNETEIINLITDIKLSDNKHELIINVGGEEKKIDLLELLTKNIKLEYNNGTLNLQVNTEKESQTIFSEVAIPIITTIIKENNVISFERGELEPINLELEGIKNIDYSNGELQLTYLNNETKIANINLNSDVNNSCECVVKNITFENNILTIDKNSNNIDIDFNTLITYNDITNIEINNNNIKFHYNNEANDKTIDLPNSINYIGIINNQLNYKYLNNESTLIELPNSINNISINDNQLRYEFINNQTNSVNIINDLKLNVIDDNLQLSINNQICQIPLTSLQTTSITESITRTMNTIEADYLNRTYQIECCGNKTPLKIFDNYHDIVTEYEDGKFKSIIFSNYYTMIDNELTFDVDQTLANLNYSLMLGGTKLVTSESIPTSILIANFDNFEITQLTSCNNYSKLKKIWYNDSYSNITNLTDLTHIKFE